MPSDTFLAAYLRFVLEAARQHHPDNYDAYRYGESRRLRRWIKSFLWRRGYQLFNRRLRKVDALSDALRSYLPHLEPLEWLHTLLADAESREVLRQTLAYRAMGPFHVWLPLNTPAYWGAIRALERSGTEPEFIDLGFMQLRILKLDLRPYGYNVVLHNSPRGAHIQYVLQQYRGVTPRGAIEAEPGDVVLDCGGCFGDTALYFADRVGPDGQVFSFEFMPGNLALWRRNVNLNPPLAPRIHLVEAPVWSQSGEELVITGSGPGTKVVRANAASEGTRIATLSIDDLVEERGLDRVDFIKMDIEGAELEALKGATETLRRFRPKLAITVYHALEDYWTIPQFLDSLDLGYTFHFRHFTILEEETVLFASTS